MTSSIQIPSIPLPGDLSIPQFGVGVFQVPPEDTTENVLAAIEAGYRHIDTAKAYGNEARRRPGDPRVGPRPLRVLRHDEVLQRRSRLRLRHARAQDEPRAARDGLRRPLPDPLAGARRRTATWRPGRRSSRAQEAGLARSIGVSNFQPDHLRRIIDETGVTPAVNQIELHPYLQQAGLRREHADRGIVTEAWSPIAQGLVLDDPAIVAIAEAHGKTPAQVVLRWHIELGDRRLPEVGHGRAAAREHRHLRLQPLGRRDGADRGPRPRRAHRPGPGRVRQAVAVSERRFSRSS